MTRKVSVLSIMFVLAFTRIAVVDASLAPNPPIDDSSCEDKHNRANKACDDAAKQKKDQLENDYWKEYERCNQLGADAYDKCWDTYNQHFDMCEKMEKSAKNSADERLERDTARCMKKEQEEQEDCLREARERHDKRVEYYKNNVGRCKQQANRNLTNCYAQADAKAIACHQANDAKTDEEWKKINDEHTDCLDQAQKSRDECDNPDEDPDPDDPND